MNNNISKKEIKNYLNSYNWISWYAKINSNDNLELSIILGEPMAKKSKLDIILEEIKTIKDDINILKQDMIEVKKDIVEIKQDIVELKRDVSLIKQCPTIKKELSLL